MVQKVTLAQQGWVGEDEGGYMQHVLGLAADRPDQGLGALLGGGGTGPSLGWHHQGLEGELGTAGLVVHVPDADAQVHEAQGPFGKVPLPERPAMHPAHPPGQRQSRAFVAEGTVLCQACCHLCWVSRVKQAVLAARLGSDAREQPLQERARRGGLLGVAACCVLGCPPPSGGLERPIIAAEDNPPEQHCIPQACCPNGQPQVVPIAVAGVVEDHQPHGHLEQAPHDGRPAIRALVDAQGQCQVAVGRGWPRCRGGARR
eukprot:11199125-Lingulodinium_polyedra.AAC.1